MGPDGLFGRVAAAMTLEIALVPPRPVGLLLRWCRELTCSFSKWRAYSRADAERLFALPLLDAMASPALPPPRRGEGKETPDRRAASNTTLVASEPPLRSHGRERCMRKGGG